MKTENIKSILESKPVFPVKWGMLILMTWLILLLIFSVTIHYPQLSKADISISNILINKNSNLVELDIKCKLLVHNPINLNENSNISVNIKNKQDSVIIKLSGKIIGKSIVNSELNIKMLLDSLFEIDYLNRIKFSQNYQNADIIHYNYSFFDAILLNFKIQK